MCLGIFAIFCVICATLWCLVLFWLFAVLCVSMSFVYFDALGSWWVGCDFGYLGYLII